MNSLSVKAKFQISLKQTFCKFEGQFQLEAQGQGHKLLKVKFLRFKLLNLQGITQIYLSFKAKFILKVKVTSFQGQFDLEGQGQGHKFLYSSETFM